MRLNIKNIVEVTKCTAEQAEAVERYIDENAMLDWSEASRSAINTAARAVYDHLVRQGKIVVRPVVVESKMPTPRKEKPKAKAKGPAKGTKIAHAMVIYKEMRKTTDNRQDIISALANSMQIEKHAAAGYYQSCKRKLG